jgi:hypothetical protein
MGEADSLSVSAMGDRSSRDSDENRRQRSKS